MVNKIAIIFSILALSSTISFSADTNPANQDIKKKYAREKISDSCNSPSNVGQQECVQGRLETADNELNTVYKELIAKLPDNDGGEGTETARYLQKHLIEAQRTWIKYRDTNCLFFGEIYGGAPGWRAVEEFNCRIEMTKSRTKELKKYLKDYN